MIELKQGLIVRSRNVVRVVQIQGEEVTLWDPCFIYADHPIGVRLTKAQAELRINDGTNEVLPELPWVAFVDLYDKEWCGLLVNPLDGQNGGADYCRVRVHDLCGPDEDGKIGRTAWVPVSIVKTATTPPFPEIGAEIRRLAGQVA